jgi:hypothetical protein
MSSVARKDSHWAAGQVDCCWRSLLTRTGWSSKDGHSGCWPRSLAARKDSSWSDEGLRSYLLESMD